MNEAITVSHRSTCRLNGAGLELDVSSEWEFRVLSPRDRRGYIYEKDRAYRHLA